MKGFVCVIAMLLGLAAPITAYAQDGPQADSSRPLTRTPDQILKMCDMKLSLTDGQKDLLTPLIADRQVKLQELRQDTSMRPREKLRKLEATTESSDKKMNAVLTPDQQRSMGRSSRR